MLQPDIQDSTSQLRANSASESKDHVGQQLSPRAKLSFRTTRNRKKIPRQTAATKDTTANMIIRMAQLDYEMIILSAGNETLAPNEMDHPISSDVLCTCDSLTRSHPTSNATTCTLNKIRKAHSTSERNAAGMDWLSTDPPFNKTVLKPLPFEKTSLDIDFPLGGFDDSWPLQAYMPILG